MSEPGRRFTDEQIDWLLRALRPPDLEPRTLPPNVVDLAEQRRLRRADPADTGPEAS